MSTKAQKRIALAELMLVGAISLYVLFFPEQVFYARLADLPQQESTKERA